MYLMHICAWPATKLYICAELNEFFSKNSGWVSALSSIRKMYTFQTAEDWKMSALRKYDDTILIHLKASYYYFIRFFIFFSPAQVTPLFIFLHNSAHVPFLSVTCFRNFRSPNNAIHAQKKMWNMFRFVKNAKNALLSSALPPSIVGYIATGSHLLLSRTIASSISKYDACEILQWNGFQSGA